MNLRLKELRKARKLTQTQLGELVGVDMRTISNWECGRTQMDMEQAWCVCRALKCSVNDLVGWKDTPLSPQEQQLISDFRASSPAWKQNILMSARAAASASRSCPA